MDTASSNVYAEHGAAHVVQLYSAPVNYQDSSGAWVPIQPELTSDGSGGYKNSAGPFQLHFPASWSTTSPVTFGDGAFSLGVSVDGMSSTPVSPAATALGAVYRGALSGVDVAFTSTTAGYRDVITLESASAPSTVTLDATVGGGITLASESDGSIGILGASGKEIGAIPAPMATDAAINPSTGDSDEGHVSYQLTSTGPSSYAIAIVVDPTWLSQATFPVRIDPTISPTSSIDTYVDDGFPNTSYGSSTTLDVKNVTGGTAQHAYALFPVGSYFQSGRIILGATIQMYATAVAKSSTVVNLKKVTGGWGEGMTWNTQPSTAGTIYDTDSGTTGSWFSWNATTMFQQIFDDGVNDGAYFGATAQTSNNEIDFASSETTIKDANGNYVRPTLTLQYDDPPNTPSLSAPATNDVLTYGSPTLSVSGNVGDPNGSDTVVIKYQIAKSSDTGFSNPVYDSGWLENGDSSTVPAGTLLDGQSYIWRVVAWDGWKDPSGNEITTTSSTRSFTVVLPHFGDDSRWPMWSDGLGNGMSLKVNESTGNLFLDYPIDTITTPVGPLDLGLTYNSLDSTGSPGGLGQGWTLSAGPGTDPSQLPVGLASIDFPNALEIRNRDGSRQAFSKAWTGNTLHVWSGSGANVGTITEDTDGTTTTYTYETTSGGRFDFDSNGHLIDANPETTDDGQPGFSYTFSGSPLRLIEVDQPLGLSVTFGYDANHNLHTITESGLGESRSWTVSADSSGRIQSVTDPESRVVQFGYTAQSDGQTYLTSVEDGGGASDTWQIGYVNPNLPSPMTAPMMQVSSVTDPGTYNKSDGTTPAIPPTQFSYSGPYTGNVASLATITDPKGNITKVEMDTEGFPIDIQQPQESIGGTMTTPQTTMVWDTNGNLLCKRSPAANAIALGCTAADPTDPLETDYTYDSLSPHKLVEEQGPKPNPNGTGSRPTWTYNYDEGLTGVLQEDYNSTSFEGMPLNRHISNASTPVSENWGSGQPEGITSPGGWAVRYSGRLHATQSTEKYYHFRVYAQGGVRLVVNHKVIEDCWNTNYSNSTYNCGSNTDGSIELPAGTVVYFDVEYRHFSGSNGVIDVKWDNGAGGSFSSMAPAPLDPGLHLLTSSSNPAGLTTTYTYSAADEVRGQPTSILTSDGTSSRQENFSYDSYGRVTADTHAAGTAAATTVATQYSADHPCASQITDGAGEVSTYQCDAEGDLTQTTKLAPAVSGTQQTHQDQTTTTVYNGDGQPTSVQQTGAPATTTQYYATGQVKTTTDPLGHVAFYTYTPSGQVATETLNYQDPASQQEQLSYHYDADGDQTAVIKEYGGGTNYEWDTGYDAQNRVTSQLIPGVPFATQYAYDQPSTLLSGDHGFLTTSVTAPNGVQTTTTDDLDGNAVDSQVGTQSAHPLNPTTRSYSTAGYVLSTTDPNGITRSATYDGWGDTVTQTEPSGTSGALETTTNTYDAAGNLTSVTNPSQAVTAYTYDGDGHIATTTQPNATVSWQFTYDGAGQQIEVTDPDGRVRDWRYNQLGQVAATYEYPQSGTTYETDKSYDADGDLTETTPPTGANLCYTYDDYGNQTSRYTVPNGSTCSAGAQSNSETFTYNPLSGVTTATEGTSGPETTITYDPQNPGRVSQVTESTGSQTTYAYNSQNGQLTSTTDALEGTTNTTRYGYDPTSGVVSSVTDPFSGVATTYAYNPGGQVTGRTDPNGLTTTYGYDADGRLGTQTTAPTGGGSAVLSFTVGYDKDSRVTSLAQAYPSVGGQANPGTGTWTYTYTTRNELKTSQFGSNPTTTYTYDGANNRQTVTIGAGSPVTWSYDNAGRLTSVGSTTYTWNPENQLTAVGSTRSYSYDPWGRQSQATVGSQTVNYGYDALSRTLTSAISGANTTTFNYTGSTQTPFATQVGSQATVYYAQGVGGLLAQQQSGTTRIDYTDPHGDLAMLANVGATPTGTLSYDPFGAQDGTDSGSAGADAQASLLGYQSQPTDPTTGLVDMGARLYDPTQGRFTTQDTQFGTPTDPASLNQYLYAQDSEPSRV